MTIESLNDILELTNESISSVDEVLEHLGDSNKKWVCSDPRNHCGHVNNIDDLECAKCGTPDDSCTPYFN